MRAPPTPTTLRIFTCVLTSPPILACSNEDGAKELVRVMQEVGFASLTAREAAPDLTASECGADMELYMHDCRQLIELGLKRWGGDAPGRLGPRVLNPDDHHDHDMIKRMFAPQPEADGTAAGSPPLQLQQQVPAQAALPPAPQGSTVGKAVATAAGSAAGAPQPMEVEAPPALVLMEPLSCVPSGYLDVDNLVLRLKGVLDAELLDEAVVGRLLDRLEGPELTAQDMRDSGAPPPRRAPCSRTCTAHPACPNACAARCPQPHLSLAAPCRRVQAGQQAWGRERRQARGV